MAIKTKLTRQDLVNVNLMLLYNKIWMKIFTAFMVLWIIAIIVAAIVYPNISFLLALGPLFILAAQPLLTYYGTVRNYNANSRIRETIEYCFEKDYLSLAGESFTSTLSWDKIYKVTQTKDWLLIWQNRYIVNPIPRGDVSQQQISEIKEILQKHQLKNNL